MVESLSVRASIENGGASSKSEVDLGLKDEEGGNISRN